MGRKSKTKDDLLPEYDLSKLKLVGRGIYAERYRSETNLEDQDQTVNATKLHPRFPDIHPVSSGYSVGFTSLETSP